MINSKRYFNQKFIALVLVWFGTTILAHQQTIGEYVYAATILIAYGIFAGLEAFSITKEGITMEKQYD